MKIYAALPILAAFALGACGSNEEEAEGTAAAGETVAMQPGQYQATIELQEFDVPGLEPEQVEQLQSMFASSVAEGHTYCIAADEAETSARELAEKLADGDCTVNSFDYSGNTLAADMVCSLGEGPDAPSGPVKINGTIMEDSSTMTVAMEQSVPGVPGDGKVNMRVKMDSQRTGDCPA
jgi:hypothetical protein